MLRRDWWRRLLRAGMPVTVPPPASPVETSGPWPLIGIPEQPEVDPPPHVGSIPGRPLVVPQEPAVRPEPMLCRRCQVRTAERRCWNCGQLPYRPVPAACTGPQPAA